MIIISKLLILLLIVLGLSACDPMSVAVSAGASTGVAAYQERGIKGLTSDTAIEAKIFKSWINTDNSMARYMSIEVYESRVLLTGIAKTEEERAVAVGLAWKVDGVKDVMNEIFVGNTPSFIEIARDTAITTELKSRLTFSKEILAVNYAIETIQGQVFLLGIAQDQAELDRVIDLAQNISYVKRIITHVRVKEPRAKAIGGD
jgi:osmotically-inducible protein OsmY